MPGHPADPEAAYQQLLQSSRTRMTNQPLITLVHNGHPWTVMVCMLARALGLMLHALRLDTGLYSLHSFHRGSAMAAYRAGAEQLDIKRHGILSSNAFWVYFTAPYVAILLVARALVAITTASRLFLCTCSLHVNLVYWSSFVLANYLCFAYLTLYIAP